MATNVTCSICLESFKQPRIIDCFHTFCLDCLEDYTKQFTGTFPCPICRATIKIPKGGVKTFNNNFYINTFTEDNACTNHQDGKAELYCERCSEAICVRCVTKHNGHSLLDLEDEKTMVEAMKRTVSNKTKLTFHKNKLEGVKDTLEKTYSKLNTSTKTAHEQIDAKVQQICDDVRRLGNQLKTVITDMSNVQQTKLDTVNIPIQQLSSDVELALNLSEKNTSVHFITVLNTLKLSNDVIKKQFTVDLPKIPDITFPEFNTNDTNVISAEQIGQCTSDNKLNINTTFDFNDSKDDKPIYSPHTKIAEDLSFYLAAKHETSTSKLGLFVHLQLPENIESCNTSFTITLHSSVTDKSDTRRQEYEFVRGEGGQGWSFIDWATFTNRTNGFIDENDKFTVSATLSINNITHSTSEKINTTFDVNDLNDESIHSPNTKITDDLSCYLSAKHVTSTSKLGLYVCLQLPEHIESCNTSYTITLHSSVTGKSITGRAEYEFVRGVGGRGWSSFIDWATFIDRPNGFIDGNDKLTVSATLLINNITHSTSEKINTTFDVNDLKDDESISSPHTKITEDLSCYLAAEHRTSTSKLVLGVHLKLPEHIESCNTSFTITLHSSVTGKSITSRQEHEFVRGGTGRGWEFIDWAKFIDRTNGFIDGHDKFTVSATLSINYTKRKGDVT